MKRRQREEQERMAQERSQQVHGEEKDSIKNSAKMAQEYEQAPSIESVSQGDVGDDDEDIDFHVVS